MNSSVNKLPNYQKVSRIVLGIYKLMSKISSAKLGPHHILAILCVGVFAGAMALNSISSGKTQTDPQNNILWNTFQYVLPLLIGAVCLTGKRLGAIVAVIYATIGLSLDLATLVQSIPTSSDSTEFIIVVLTTSFLNFSLIVFGGKYILTPISLKISPPH